ncbi:MAG TPA: hypothetical protein DGK91_06690 [Clostridium sp.]|jgi:hypothetical protein|nr:DUF1906 domain-containing protein [Clostridia bacterium]HCW04226.1 hypothetical protein [Clostridium sp.]
MKLIRVFGLSFIIAISALAYTETKAEVVKVNTSNKYSLTEEETNLLRKTDLNLDMIIDMEDLAIASEAYNTRDKLANVNDEPIVDIYDLTLISKNMDKAYEESGYIQSAGSVNFRKGPGEKEAVLYTLDKGTSLTIIGKSDHWYKVRHKDNEGYVAAQFVVADIAKKGFDTYGALSLSQYQQFKEDGYSFVARYYSTTDSAKNLTKDEAQAASEAGLELLAVYQDYNNKADLFNYEYGVTQATEAIKQAIEVGQPPSVEGKGSAIYFAVDEKNVGDIPLANIEEYFKGIKDTMDKFTGNDPDKRRWDIGVYGNYRVVKYLQEKMGSDLYLWQTSMGKGQENYFSKYFNYDIYQNLHEVYRNGVFIDENYTNVKGDFGAFTLSLQQ